MHDPCCSSGSDQAALKLVCDQLAAHIRLLPDFKRRLVLAQWNYILAPGRQQHVVTGRVGHDQPKGEGEAPESSVIATAAPEASLTVDFTPSDRWAGPKPGYVYKAGGQGLGYYLDARPDVLTHSAVSARRPVLNAGRGVLPSRRFRVAAGTPVRAASHPVSQRPTAEIEEAGSDRWRRFDSLPVVGGEEHVRGRGSADPADQAGQGDAHCTVQLTAQAGYSGRAVRQATMSIEMPFLGSGGLPD